MSARTTRICLVDRDAGFTRLLRRGLEETGRYRVREVNHPGRTLESARNFRPDVILLDHALPEIQDLDIEGHLNGDKYLCEASIVYLASMVDRHESGGFAFRNSDGRVYLNKPVSIDSLRNCIHFDLPIWNRDRVEPDYPGFDVAI